MNKHLNFKTLILALASAGLISCGGESSENKTSVTQNLSEKVNLFIGTGSHGHTFPSAMVPFGAVVTGPDCATVGWDAAGGYHYDAPTILGFSQQHLSGTGLTELGDIMLMPTVGKVQMDPGQEDKPESGYRSRFSHDDETAEPGYYQVRLQDYNVNVELTATERVGFHKYTFPKSDSAHILLDLVHQIAGGGSQVQHGYVRIHDNQTVTGFRFSNAVWAPNRQVHFAIKFSKPFDSRFIWDGSRSSGFTPNVKTFHDLADRGGDKIKAMFNFKTEEGEQILVKIAVSSVSMNNAMENLETEIPEWNFEDIRAEADRKWEVELNKFHAKGEPDNLAKFYAAVYHNCIHPTINSDVNGQYRSIDKQVYTLEKGTYYHMFSLWDTFRATHPLFTLMHQKRTDDIVNSMLIFQKQNPTKMLPMWSMYQDENTCMIGLHSFPVIADAHHKGLLSASDDEILNAMIVSSNEPGVDSTQANYIYPSYYGQFHYLEKGYHPNDLVRSGVSVTLEHAYDDWSLALAANQSGKDEVTKTYLERAQYYNNVWDTETKFFRSKYSDGKFREPFEPRAYHREEFWDRDYIEGNAWQYLFFAPHDVYGLIDLMGGKDIFKNRLDTMFSLPTIESAVGDVSGLIGDYAHGNEPCHHVAYLYNYAGASHRTQEIIHQVNDEFYKNAPDGYIGNEDAGQMSAWYVFSAMGFYPVNPAGGIYIIGSPLLEEVKLNMEHGKTFAIQTKNYAKENIYIQSVSLNGQAYENVWLDHKDIVAGGTLEFVMGSEPSDWGKNSEKVPYADGSVN